ncbi:MAG TPA: glutamyl-tRNA reductase [Blastocatellia bacterium]|nr:glutamyl-tRNA reductase [Blastocatellia bacterium]HMX30525.1 glutamyl-tRNA reductase [Blastocatellia bacterium]HMY72419.1 glutamyl-tRNA reductase [Blastocatellia bacterium]HNG32227.1 glutamyl-tRNA reductase [Blastocatellia bacterium]
MSIILIGVSHKTAPVEVRERLAFAESRLPDALQQLVDQQTISEGVIVSTCNRVEVIAATVNHRESDSQASHLYNFLHRFHGCEPSVLSRHCYHQTDLSAIKHIFRVTASLDSMVVGEPQITGQVKEAFQRAQEHGSVGHTLTRLMNKAFAVAKRVRNETGIGSSAVSISFVAVELARKVFDTLNGATVMLVGAGEMAELAAKHLLNYGASKILIANRTYENAVKLAEEMKGEPVRFEDFERRMSEADVVICSTGATHYLISPTQVKQALQARRNRPMLLVDISVPRNIDPKTGNLDNVFVFDVDDLQSIAEANRAEREREAVRAEAIIAEEAERFAAALAEGDTNAVIGAFRQEANALAFAELERSRKRLGNLSQDQEEALRVMLNSIVNKFTLPVIKQLRESEDGHSPYLSAWREMYHRDGKER